MEKVFESFGYIQLAMVICGQLIMNITPLGATIFFFIGNCIAVSRVFVLKRPMSDKIKDCSLLLISVVSFILSMR